MFDTTGSFSGFPFAPALCLGGLFGALIARTDLDAWLNGGDLPAYVKRQVAAKDPARLDTPDLPRVE